MKVFRDDELADIIGLLPCVCTKTDTFALQKHFHSMKAALSSRTKDIFKREVE